jgi:hypothetical protein
MGSTAAEFNIPVRSMVGGVVAFEQGQIVSGGYIRYWRRVGKT